MQREGPSLDLEYDGIHAAIREDIIHLTFFLSLSYSRSNESMSTSIVRKIRNEIVIELPEDMKSNATMRLRDIVIGLE